MENTQIKQETQDYPSGSFIESNFKKFKQAEWVFQFDGEEPIVFAWCNSPSNDGEDDNLVLKLTPTSDCSLNFKSYTGRELKIFAREITDQTLKMLEQDGRNVIGTEEV